MKNISILLPYSFILLFLLHTQSCVKNDSHKALAKPGASTSLQKDIILKNKKDSGCKLDNSSDLNIHVGKDLQAVNDSARSPKKKLLLNNPGCKTD